MGHLRLVMRIRVCSRMRRVLGLAIEHIVVECGPMGPIRLGWWLCVVIWRLSVPGLCEHVCSLRAVDVAVEHVQRTSTLAKKLRLLLIAPWRIRASIVGIEAAII